MYGYVLMSKYELMVRESLPFKYHVLTTTDRQCPPPAARCTPRASGQAAVAGPVPPPPHSEPSPSPPPERHCDCALSPRRLHPPLSLCTALWHRRLGGGGRHRPPPAGGSGVGAATVRPRPAARGGVPSPAAGCLLQGSLSLPGSPFNIRRGSHQLTWRAANGRKLGDRKPLVLSTYMDAQEHLPYADDSAAVTPMSEENGTMVLPVFQQQPSSLLAGSRHGSYTSHGSRRSYNSHGDLLNGRGLTKESQLRSRRAPPADAAEMQHDCVSTATIGRPRMSS